MRIIRAGEHIQHIPGYGITVRESGVAVAASSNWWEVSGKTCVAAYQPKGAASYAASLVNLANPGTYNATEGSAPAWASATGWTFALGNYLTAGFTADYTWTGICQFATVSAADCRIFGHNTWPNRWTVSPNNFGNVSIYVGSGVVNNAAGFASGNIAIAGQVAYKNGTALANSSTGTPAPSGDIRLAYSGEFPDGGLVIVAEAFYSDVLSADEVLTVVTAMAAL